MKTTLRASPSTALLLLSSLLLSSLLVGALNPIVFFPGYGLSILRAEVDSQTSIPECKESGTFDLYFGGPDEVDGFNASCMTRLLSFHYESDDAPPTNLPGVTVELLDYPSTKCSPYYEPFYNHLNSSGYVDGESLFVACFDWRTAPNVDVIEGSNFMQDTLDLVIQAYEMNDNQKVFLAGHSNGPIMAQYFLDHLSQEQKDKYIAGFLPYAGNWAGQGFFFAVLISGLSVVDFTPLPEAAAAFETWPSSYFSLAQPEVFTDLIIVASTPERNYTSLDYDDLFDDSGLTLAKKLWRKYNGLVKPSKYPNVPVVGFYGSGLETLVGIEADSFSVGGPTTGVISSLGDANQEYITNDAFLVWKGMKCYTFEPHDLANVDHFSLMTDDRMLDATTDVLLGVTPLKRGCSSAASTLSMPWRAFW